MNRLLIVLLLLASLQLKAQNYPSEWMRYTTDAYFHDIEHGSNSQNLSEAKFKNDLLDGECTFTQGDGFYFKGTAKNGDWYQGDWYDKKGNHVSRVVEGKEIDDTAQ